MLEVMTKATVGDDVFGEDPSINELESYAAELFGMESAIFCPSGTMTNQIAIKCHTQPGNEVICEKLSHIYQYEAGGIAFNSGCQVKLIDGDRGRIKAAQVEKAINPDDLHKAPSTLVSIENTSNRGGGSCYDFEDIREIRKICDKHRLRFHLDGARLFNAIVARNENPKQYGAIFDSISICLSKSLGAPVGSLLLGSRDFVGRARRIRKIFGGGMRQAGFLAAAGLYALRNNIERLGEDHLHAKQIAAELEKKEFVSEIMPVETNIIIFELKPPFTSKDLAEQFRSHNILVIPISPTQIRMVLHLDISGPMVEDTCTFICQL
jgi:threonine aldolase